jgi:outer membrane receptor protein involved in Fe transport
VDADILGLEIESSFLVTENFRLDAQIGYISTEIGDVQSIDTSNLTQGDAAYTVVNSIDSGSFAEACIVPTAEVAGLLGAIAGGFAPSIAMGTLCTGPTASPNALEGIEVDVSGNELPSTPSYTAAIGAEYSMMFNNSDWEATARADYYRQADSFARIYNTAADKIKSWDNLNLSYRLSNESTGWEVQVYARNILSKDTVTNIQLNSTSTGGSSVVSGKERPMYGISVSKSWF